MYGLSEDGQLSMGWAKDGLSCGRAELRMVGRAEDGLG